MRHFISDVFKGKVDVFQSSDQRAIYAGDEWMAKIFEALETAKVLISMLSPVSVTRPWTNFEAGAAWMRKAKVIPVCFGGLTIAGLPKPYSSLQSVEIDTPEACYYLADSVAQHLGLERPEHPDFSANTKITKGSLLGSQPKIREAARQTELGRPYKRLASWVAVSRKLSGTDSPGF